MRFRREQTARVLSASARPHHRHSLAEEALVGSGRNGLAALGRLTLGGCGREQNHFALKRLGCINCPHVGAKRGSEKLNARFQFARFSLDD